VQPRIALTGVFKPLPTRCKLFQSCNFRSTHVDPFPSGSTSPTGALCGSPYPGSRWFQMRLPWTWGTQLWFIYLDGDMGHPPTPAHRKERDERGTDSLRSPWFFRGDDRATCLTSRLTRWDGATPVHCRRPGVGMRAQKHSFCVPVEVASENY
jgi:hypothetical protein